MAYIADSAASEEINRLTEQVERLKDDLFDLAPLQKNQASDATITSDYLELCQSIDFWVDNVIEDSSFDKHYKKGDRREQSVLKSVGISHFTVRNERSYAYFLLSVAIQRELQRKIFDRHYPIGVVKQQGDVIDLVLEGMKKLESGKEQIIRDRWRSEAVRGLTALDDLKQSQAGELNKLARAFMDFVSPKKDPSICGLDHRAFQKHSDILYGIFIAAGKLHQDLRSSIFQYRIQLPKVDVNVDGEQMAESGWKLRDVDKWRDVAETGQSARPLCSLYPSVVREGGDGHGKPRTLVPPTIVVEFPILKASAQASRIHSTRPSPTHSVSSDPASRETTRRRDRGGASEQTTHTSDSARSREPGRDAESTHSLSSSSEHGFLGGFTKSMAYYASGRYKRFSKPRRKSPGKAESARDPGSPKGQNTQEDEHVYVRDRWNRESEHDAWREQGDPADFPGIGERRSATDGYSYFPRGSESHHDYHQDRRRREHYDEAPRKRRNSENVLHRTSSL
ncbi:hypothetical protein PV04_07212 [Phialophora macrospora]|uniref:Uncharacterized protein n=1 Tax=Phialophora macrospora TaxID=1851006 RepID=A0A0D2FA67_9EURO|nr:hypothetical protein PV04_07212 [Phialophora macrospora]